MNAAAWSKWFFVTLAALSLAGCVTGPRINWAARVGHYTYDQAVTDLGPPDKSATLSDGSRVAEWLERPAEIIITSEPYFVPPGCYWAPFPPMYSTSREPALYLRLTFSPDGKLAQFREVAR